MTGTEHAELVRAAGNAICDMVILVALLRTDIKFVVTVRGRYD
jgi:hypothetical protein